MVDRVELIVFDEREQVLNLDRQPAVVGNHGAQPLGEAHNVGNMG